MNKQQLFLLQYFFVLNTVAHCSKRILFMPKIGINYYTGLYWYDNEHVSLQMHHLSFALAFLAMLVTINQIKADCCWPTGAGGICGDCTKSTSCCGHGPCNIFCCNCDAHKETGQVTFMIKLNFIHVLLTYNAFLGCKKLLVWQLCKQSQAPLWVYVCQADGWVFFFSFLFLSGEMGCVVISGGCALFRKGGVVCCNQK